MNKTKKYQVVTPIVGASGVKKSELQAKSIERLISAMPKAMRKKWKSISWVNEAGETVVLTREQHENQLLTT